jgi:hypothetical protein
MWHTLKFKVIGVVCTVALVGAVLPILVAAPFGLLFWLIKTLGLTLVRLGLWLQGLLDAYLTGWGTVIRRIDEIATNNEERARQWFRENAFKVLEGKESRQR